jgi:acetyl esterase/lipase
MEVLGSTYETNAGKDVLGSREGAAVFVAMFLGENGNRQDPLANPLFATVQGLPPILIQAAGDDMLLDDSLRFYSKATAVGVDVTLHVAPGTQHVYQFMAGASARADEAVAQAAAWVRTKIGLN